MKEEMSLHEWIYNYIEEAIRFGIFRQGEKLPTISQFAERFQVSRRPVIHAFKLLEEHHYIEMSRGRHSRLTLGLNEEECRENCIQFFLERKYAVQDLCEIRNILLPDLFSQALCLLKEEQYAAIHKSIDQMQGERTVVAFVETVLSVFGNPLVCCLYMEVAIFGRLSFYEKIKDSMVLQGIRAHSDTTKVHAFIDAIHQKQLTHQDIYEITKKYFVDDSRKTQECYAKLPQRKPERKVSFRWNIYRGRPRQIYNIASSLLKDIIYQIYPVESRLPRVLDLCEIYQVSEPTLRRAMSILQATGVIQPIGGKGMKVIQCEENRIHEMLEDNGVRERVIEGMQCLQILQLTCQAFTTMSFTSMVQRHEQLQQALSNTEITSINWVRLICEYCDSIMDVNKQESLKSIFEELKQHILWVYPFICHLDKERYQSIFCHTFDVLRYAMKTRDGQLYVSEMKYLFYLVLEEVRSQLEYAGVKEAKDLKMISFRMDI